MSSQHRSTSASNKVAVSLSVLCLAIAGLLTSCRDSGHSSATPGTPADPGTGGSMLGRSVDVVYVCENKFLVTNATPAPIHVRYRVAGTDETGGLTLAPGPGGDPGYSETELETRERGVVELYLNDEQVARRANEAQACGAPAIAAAVAGTNNQVGSWSAPFRWPVVAIHLSLLPNGRVLSWGFGGHPQVWNPATGSFTEIPEPVELLCGGNSLLADGRVLVAGGHISDDHGLPDITIFTPGTSSWSRSARMRRGRWYPTATTLPSGGAVILAGRDESGLAVAEPEVWEAGRVRVLSTAGRVFPYYPRTFLAPDGRIFYAGEQRRSRFLTTSGTGRWTAAGDRLYGGRDYGAAVMYDDGKIIYVGGGRTTATAEIIDLNIASPAWRWTGSMASPRRHHNATVLPTGEVLVTGGTSGTAFDDQTKPVRAAELWNPATGTWRMLASNAVTRTYHGTSILLPDGRVLHAGSGSRTTTNELNAELFSPPYLFKGTRPTISSSPSTVQYGTTFTVGTSQATAIASVSLIRLGSTTHAFDMNQRFQRLRFTRLSGALSVSAPTSRNRTPPGHYMLFIVNGNGVPSVAKIVRVR